MHGAPIVDDLDLDLDLKKPQVELVKLEEKPAVAPGIKPEEANEPLLQENPQRFVLFPIKYHEVRVLLTRLALSASSQRWLIL